MNSTSDMEPSINAFEINLLIESAEDSARETVFSCFVIFLLSLLPPMVIVVEMKPSNPAIPARGVLTITTIPLNDIPNPVDDKAAAVTPVRADVG